jgi:hypothetical protein
LEPLQPVSDGVVVSGIALSGSARDVPPEFAARNADEVDAADFLPFGETASVFDECVIGQDGVFSQAGAEVTLEFDLSYIETRVDFTPQQVSDQLKIIKKKPRRVTFETARTQVDQVSFEYFNGTGWKRLVTQRDCSTLFDGTVFGAVEIRFLCPDDWQPLTAGAGFARGLRLRINRADNCYLQPCVHKMPAIKNLRFHYSYHGVSVPPEKVVTVKGTKRTDVTRRVLSHMPFLAAGPLPGGGDALYLGFDKAFAGAPVNLFFDIDGNAGGPEGESLVVEYATTKGFLRTRVQDGTRSFSRPGVLSFGALDGFAPLEIEGEKRYWLRITGKNEFSRTIRQILSNACEVVNTRTYDEEAFYVEAARAHMSFRLSADNLISADVFVNETRLGDGAQKALLAERPRDVRVEYDFWGNTREFFVRWEEVDNFDSSRHQARHYVLDRAAGKIIFGDGVNAAVPPAGTEVSFTAKVKSCDGSRGNLEPDRIDALTGGILYLDRVYNPRRTYGGRDMESFENARARGAAELAALGRLVSTRDYIGEAKGIVGAEAEVSCVAGLTPTGKAEPGAMSIVIMAREPDYSGFAFKNIAEELQTRLSAKGETGRLYVTEPTLVRISTEVFVSETGDTFDFGREIIAAIEGYISPFDPEGKAVWKPGQLPDMGGLAMRLAALPWGGLIRHITAVCEYADAGGIHTRSLRDFEPTAFCLAVSGTHKVRQTKI